MRPNVHKNPCLFGKHLGKHNRRIWCILNWQEKDTITWICEERRRQGDGKSLSPSPPPQRGGCFLSWRDTKRATKGGKDTEGTQDIRLSDTSYPRSGVHILRVQKTDVKTMP